MLVHQFGKARQVALQKRRVASPAEVLYVMQVVDHRRVLCLGLVVLVLQDGRRCPCIASEEKTQPVLEIVEQLLADSGRTNLDAVVLVKLETSDAAIGGDKLILLARGLAEEVDLDMAGLLCKGMRADDVPLAGVQRTQQCGRKTARGTEAGAGRNIGHARDLYPVVTADEIERGAYDRMPDVSGPLDPFQLGILDDVARLKGPV